MSRHSDIFAAFAVPVMEDMFWEEVRFYDDDIPDPGYRTISANVNRQQGPVQQDSHHALETQECEITVRFDEALGVTDPRSESSITLAREGHVRHWQFVRVTNVTETLLTAQFATKAISNAGQHRPARM